jgi:hypothetical protein
MGGLPVKKLPELFDSVFDGLVVVPVRFDSVVEGVDMWFKGQQVDSIPRYFFRLSVIFCCCLLNPGCFANFQYVCQLISLFCYQI